MKKFIPKVTIFKKLAVIVGICLVFGLAIAEQFYFREVAADYRPYYLKSNLAALEYQMDPLTPMPVNTDAVAIPALLYHGIVDKPNGVDVTFEDFRDQIMALKAAGYNTISLEDLDLFLKGEKTLPDKSFLLTMDDGRKDSFYPVDPFLQTLDYKAVMFTIAGITDKNPAHLTSRQLKAMSDSGRWEIESHGFNDHEAQVVNDQKGQGHFMSNKLWLADLNREETDEEYNQRIYNDLLDSKKYLENITKKPVTAFAFPFNDYGQEGSNNPQAQEAIARNVRAVYSHALYQTSLTNITTYNLPAADNFMVKRIDISPNWRSNDLFSILDSGKPKSLPYVSNFNQNQGWTPIRDNFSFSSNHLEVSSGTTNTGNTVFLGGTSLWKNYTFSALIDWQKGSNIFLLARYIDDSNYLAFNITDERIRIEQRINGETKILAEQKNSSILPKENLEIGLRVDGNSITAGVNGEPPIHFDGFDASLSAGGIGFKTWDPQNGNTDLVIKKVVVANEQSN